MFEDSYLDTFMEDHIGGGAVDHYWEDDFETFNQNEADDYRHEFDEFDDHDGGDFDEWEGQFDSRCSWDEV